MGDRRRSAAVAVASERGETMFEDPIFLYAVCMLAVLGVLAVGFAVVHRLATIGQRILQNIDETFEDFHE